MGMSQKELEEFSAKQEKEFEEAKEAKEDTALTPEATVSVPAKRSSRNSAPRVARMTNSEALKMPQISTLFERAFQSDPFTKWEWARDEVERIIDNPASAVFIAVDNGEPVGMTMVHLPTSVMLPFPSVSHFYVDGRRTGAREAMINAVVDFIVGSGYTRFIAVNVSKRTDAAWQRVFRTAGTSKALASIMEFTIGA